MLGWGVVTNTPLCLTGTIMQFGPGTLDTGTVTEHMTGNLNFFFFLFVTQGSRIKSPSFVCIHGIVSPESVTAYHAVEITHGT